MERESLISRLLCSIVLLLLILLLSTFWTLADAEETTIKDKQEYNSPCSLSLTTLYKTITRYLFPDGFDVYINCLAFDELGDLERGIASGYNNSETNQTKRFVIGCRKNVLFARESAVAANMSDIRDQGYSACLECEDATEPCKTSCDSSCEKCFNNYKRCTACTRYRLLNSYPASDDIDPHDPISEESKCSTDERMTSYNNYSEFHCVHDCPDNGNHSSPNEKQMNTCFACSLENCVECELNSTNHDGSGSGSLCTSCLKDTVLFHGQCYACPLADVAQVAIKQEEEKRKEKHDREKKRSTLAICLVVVVSCVVAVFIQVTVYAHHVYSKSCQCRPQQKQKKKRTQSKN